MTGEWVRYMSYFAKGLWVERNLAQWVTTILILVNSGLGISILLGGPSSFTLPSYEPLVDYTFGRTWIWGISILISAVLMCCRKKSISIVGLWLSMFWHIIWMAAFVMAAINFEDTAVTPIPAYAGFAMISATLLTARVIEDEG